MAVYIVAYDLNKPGQDYSKLYNELNVLGAIRGQDSLYFINSSLTTVQISERLNRWIDKGDYLFVAPISKNAAGQMEPGFWPWFNAQ